MMENILHMIFILDKNKAIAQPHNVEPKGNGIKNVKQDLGDLLAFGYSEITLENIKRFSTFLY